MPVGTVARTTRSCSGDSACIPLMIKTYLRSLFLSIFCLVPEDLRVRGLRQHLQHESVPEPDWLHAGEDSFDHMFDFYGGRNGGFRGGYGVLIFGRCRRFVLKRLSHTESYGEALQCIQRTLGIHCARSAGSIFGAYRLT